MARRWLERARRHFHSLVAGGTSPGRLAAAVFVGVVVGFTPLFGLHLLLCLLLARRLGLNLVAMYAAANISIPPLAPILGFASVQVGSRVLHGRWIDLTASEFREASLAEAVARFFADWLAGGLILGAMLGLALAAAVGGAAWLRASRRPSRARKEQARRALERATARFGPAAMSARHFVRWKVLLDPAPRAVLRFLPARGHVLDLGTGHGVLPIAVAELAPGLAAEGWDWDEEKLGHGQAAARCLDRVRLRVADFHCAEMPRADVIVALDSLHYDSAEARSQLLARCVAALAPGGLLLIRETDASEGAGAWTRLLERLAVRAGRHRGRHACFAGGGEIEQVLRTHGLRVRRIPLACPLLPANYLHVARKPSRQAASHA